MKSGDKRGISAIVATVLIILITVAAVTIIWAAIIPLIQNNLDSATQDFDVSLSIDSASGYTVYDPDNNLALIQVKRGADENEIEGVQFILMDSSGNSITQEVMESPEPNQKKVYRFDVSSLGSLSSVSIAPIYGVGEAETVSSSLDVIPEDDLSSQTGNYLVVGGDVGVVEVQVNYGSTDRVCFSLSSGSTSYQDYGLLLNDSKIYSGTLITDPFDPNCNGFYSIGQVPVSSGVGNVLGEEFPVYRVV